MWLLFLAEHTSINSLASCSGPNHYLLLAVFFKLFIFLFVLFLSELVSRLRLTSFITIFFPPKLYPFIGLSDTILNRSRSALVFLTGSNLFTAVMLILNLPLVLCPIHAYAPPSVSWLATSTS